MNSQVGDVFLTLFKNRHESCPYFAQSGLCSASITLFIPAENVKTAFCSNDNYDSCPLFLSKILRRR